MLYLKIDVGEDELLIGRVDDGGSVAAGKHIGGGHSLELAQNGGLGTQGYLLIGNQSVKSVRLTWLQTMQPDPSTLFSPNYHYRTLLVSVSNSDSDSPSECESGLGTSTYRVGKYY